MNIKSFSPGKLCKPDKGIGFFTASFFVNLAVIEK